MQENASQTAEWHIAGGRDQGCSVEVGQDFREDDLEEEGDNEGDDNTDIESEADQAGTSERQRIPSRKM